MTAAYAAPRQGHMDLSPRRALTLAQARRRSAMVRVWRWFCTGMAGLMALSIIGSAIWRSSLPGFMGDGLPTVNSPRMINPRFTGRGANAYVITAESAMRRSGNSQIVDLDKPSYSSTGGMKVRAPSGIYDPEKQTLDLAGGVIFTDSNGNRFETPIAHIDANSSLATGAQTLSGAGRFGDVKSKGFEISGNGNTLRMTGGVSGTIKGSSN
jgi:lipopolysaccharide export system protein LptC